MLKLEQAWCPFCEKFTVIPAGRPCAWCDTLLVTKRGGWKRPDSRARSRVSRTQALVMHRAHEHGTSLRAISRSVYEALGYSSAGSCLEGIRAAFVRENLTARDQSAATTRSNKQRGNRLPGEDKNAYRRRIRARGP